MPFSLFHKSQLRKQRLHWGGIISPMMFNFMCQLDWAKGHPDNYKTLFLDVCLRIFQEKKSHFNQQTIKNIHLCQSVWASHNALMSRAEQKAEKRENLLLETGHPFSPSLGQLSWFSCHQILGFLPKVLLS